MKSLKWKLVWEAMKEPLRLLVIALIPFGSAYFGSLSYEWAAIIVLVLRFADKMLHELGKANEDKDLIKGLTRF